MSEEKAPTEPTLVEKWIKDQQEWQRTWMEYFDSMVNNDEFLTHLGNAMRGSLLAGKPYPGSEPEEAEAPAQTPVDDRLDEILHALHRLQGEVADLRMNVGDLGAKLEQLSRLRPVPEASASPESPDSSPPGPEAGHIDRGEG
jgi:hypothetical protein